MIFLKRMCRCDIILKNNSSKDGEVMSKIKEKIMTLTGGVCATLTTLLISDCVEYAEWKTGERTEGITFSITKLITKTSAALISSLTMFILASVNYDPTAMQKTLDVGGSIAGTYPDVLNMIYILMTLSLSAAFILQMIPMLFYKFEGEEQKKILDELNARRANTDA